MEIVNEVTPSDPAQVAEMMAAGPEGPIFMVNLLKFKDTAVYEDGRDSDLTGRQAYEIYGRGVMKILGDYNGKFVFAGDVTFLSLGQADELWDEVAIVRYSCRADLWAMSTSDAWRELSVHRTAGLAGQLNIETVGSVGIPI